MSAENNKDILLRANEAVTNSDHEAFLADCADDITWVFIGDRTLHGKQAVRDYMAETYTEPPKFNVQHLIAEGDFVTAVGKITLKENGEYTTYDYCDLWRFSNGKMIELTAFVIKV